MRGASPACAAHKGAALFRNAYCRSTIIAAPTPIAPRLLTLFALPTLYARYGRPRV
jgi:hypothetical protein